MKKIKYILIAIVLVGFLSPVINIGAQAPFPATPRGDCTFYLPVDTEKENPIVRHNLTREECTNDPLNGEWREVTTPVPPTPTPPSDTTNSSYQLLAPLPLPCPDNTPGCIGKFTNFDPTSNAEDKNPKLGEYLNLMIKIFIGLCAVLAVVMIVIGGIEYMTSELPGNKEGGKERMTHAILGLLIALGSYALLNTINPSLLNTDIDIPGAKITVEFQEDENPVFEPYAGELPAGAVPSCPEGVTRVAESGFVACRSISQNIFIMLADAKRSGLNISGGGYRTPEEQRQLRIRYCNGDTTDRNAKCAHATALPGESVHQSGLAFDLTCGQPPRQITAGDACFKWLKENAGRYGLQNLDPRYGNEPWHWSINGR